MGRQVNNNINTNNYARVRTSDARTLLAMSDLQGGAKNICHRWMTHHNTTSGERAIVGRLAVPAGAWLCSALGSQLVRTDNILARVYPLMKRASFLPGYTRRRAEHVARTNPSFRKNSSIWASSAPKMIQLSETCFPTAFR